MLFPTIGFSLLCFRVSVVPSQGVLTSKTSLRPQCVEVAAHETNHTYAKRSNAMKELLRG